MEAGSRFCRSPCQEPTSPPDQVLLFSPVQWEKKQGEMVQMWVLAQSHTAAAGNAPKCGDKKPLQVLQFTKYISTNN